MGPKIVEDAINHARVHDIKRVTPSEAEKLFATLSEIKDGRETW